MTTPYQVVVFFEKLLEEVSGVRPDLHTGPEKGKNFAAAKRLLVLAESDWEAVLREWATDPWEVENHPSLTRPASIVNELRFKLARREPLSKNYARELKAPGRNYRRSK